MLLVVNISKKDVSLNDLGITLKPKQAVDIDKCNIPREKSVHSISLQSNIKDKKIRILQANPPMNSVQYKEAIVNTNEGDKIKNNGDANIDDLKNIVSEEIKKQIDSSNSQVIEQLSNIANILQNNNCQQQITLPTVLNEKNVDGENDMDMNTLMQIHSKNLNKMSKNTKSKAKYTETKTESEIDKTVSELEGLI